MPCSEPPSALREFTRTLYTRSWSIDLSAWCQAHSWHDDAATASPTTAQPGRPQATAEPSAPQATAALPALPLLEHLQPSAVWLREGQGLIGLGEIAAQTSAGARRFQELHEWFTSLDIRREDPADPSLIAFTSLSFSPRSQAASVLMIPEVLLRIGDDAAQLTVVSVDTPGPVAAEGFPDPDVLARHGLIIGASSSSSDRVLHLEPLATATGQGNNRRNGFNSGAEMSQGTHSAQHYLDAVSAGLERIASGEVEKLVLARDVVVSGDTAVDVPAVLANLARTYRECWTYRVGNVLGATPEMLVRVRGNQISARVLAGTLDRSVPAAAAHQALLQDTKQRAEHQLAVVSLVDALSELAQMHAPEIPAVIELPNVYHLCSDVSGELHQVPARPAGALLIAEKAHPTAAICGTPTEAAAELIHRLEELDRAGYSGPLGWLDIEGNADFGIALRGGHIEQHGHQIRLLAGCGVVEGSIPEAELAETVSKLRPMLNALGIGAPDPQ